MSSAQVVAPPAARAGQLVRASHPEPTAAVTTLAALLAVADGVEGFTLVLLVLAVLTGQLVIGWSNDLIDASRDAQVGRTDKPLASGRLPRTTVTWALWIAGLCCVPLSVALGWRAGGVHLLLVVGSGLAYNAGLKATGWSWLPYAVAFGALPTVITLSAASAEVAPPWMMLTGAMLGVGAHFVNTLPDLDDDARTGVRGLPHRLGARRSLWTAMAVLVSASIVVLAGPTGTPPWWSWAGLALVLVLAGVGLRNGGRTAFRAALLIAVVDVVTFVLRG